MNRAVRAACVAISLCAVEAGAQTNSQANAGLQFDFPLPGARSLSLGGAFVAVADDATAAVANPAGLTALLRPEVSIEGRYRRFVTFTPYDGHGQGSASNIGIDTVDGVRDRSSSATSAGPSFLSVVIPKGRFAAGFYRQEQARFRSTAQSNGPFVTVGTDVQRLPVFEADVNLNVTNWGGSVAYRFPNGLALGGGVALSDFKVDSEVDVFLRTPFLSSEITNPADRGRYTGIGQFYGPGNFVASNVLGTITEAGTDQGMAFNVGALYRPSGSKVSVGGTIRRNPSFEYQEEARYGVASVFPAPGSVISRHRVTFKMPDVYSAGAAFRPTDSVLLSLQYDRVLYSQLSEDLQNVNTGIDVAAPVPELAVPDINQLRFGAEYALVRGMQVTSFRVGTSYEPAHQMSLTGGATNAQYAALYPAGKGQWHVAPGLGVVFKAVQIDAAVNFSSRTQIVSVSAVYRF